MEFTTKTSARIGSSMVAAAALLLGDSSAASAAADAHFVAEATKIKWNGTTATVTFLEADVDLDANSTRISTRVSAAVDVVCTNEESTLRRHRPGYRLGATQSEGLERHRLYLRGGAHRHDRRAGRLLDRRDPDPRSPIHPAAPVAQRTRLTER
jgi:hypothetical protein